MSLFQAILIGIFAYLGSKRTPWFFGVTGGWNMIGRPLVAGLIDPEQDGHKPAKQNYKQPADTQSHNQQHIRLLVHRLKRNKGQKIPIVRLNGRINHVSMYTV